MLKRSLIPSALAILSLVSGGVHAANLPRPAHELTVNLIDGKKIQLSQYKGKVVAVCFILTTCPHCQKTVGFLTKLQKEYGPRGFQVLASAIEQDASLHVTGFMQQFNPSFVVGFNDGMTAVDWMQHPAMLGPHMPMLAFVDKQGNVRAQFEGDDEKFFGDQQEQNLRTQIEGLLKDTAPAKKAPATGTATPKKQSSPN